MALKLRQKIAVIGDGIVGSSVCYGIVNQGICDELLIIDRNKDKARGEALDLRQGIEYMDRNMKVHAADFADCGDCEVAIFCLGTPQSALKRDAEGHVIRSSELEAACKIVKPSVEKLMASGFNGYVVTVTNPLDTITKFIWRLSGLPSNRVIGSGTTLDSARLKCILGDIIDVDPHSINAWVLGEHGPTGFIPWSMASVGGKTMDTIQIDNPDRFRGHSYDDIKHQVEIAGPQVVNLKGHTNYAIASAAIAIARAILYDENRVMPVSTYLDGHYGCHDVFASVPAIISSDGVKEIVDLHLSKEEMDLFRRSIESIEKSNVIAQKLM